MTTMRPKDAVRYHELRAVHLRELAEQATTATIKGWLLDAAEKEEQLAADAELTLATGED
ncbi:MAG TPA: hypothetical protein VKQ73_09120 [Stellaceae bacterium]|nr:hypothetical protein [Stellaceae bacterium]